MEIRDYFRALRRRWLVIVGAVVVAVVAAGALTATITPQYASTSRVYFSTPPTNTTNAYQGGLFAQQQASSYADLVGGLGFSQKLIDTVGLDTTATNLSERIKASLVPNTVVLKIVVTDSSATEAQKVNAAAVSQLRALVRQVGTPARGRGAALRTSVVDAPQKPKDAISPRPVANVALGAAAGLVLGFVLVVVLELLNPTTRRDDA